MMKLQIFTSLEEQSLSHLKESLLLPPLQRIASTVALIKRVYGYNPNHQEYPKRIHFKRTHKLSQQKLKDD